MQINRVGTHVSRIGYLVATGLLCAVSSLAAWQAGVARVDITPSQSIWMGGYAARTHVSEGVRQHIFVKALALKDETGAVTVLVTSDLLGFPGEVSAPYFQPCATAVRSASRACRSQFVADHSAPVVGHMLSPAYPYGEAEMKVVRAFTTKLQDQIVEAIGKAIQNLSPAEVSFEQGFAGSSGQSPPGGPPRLSRAGGAGCSRSSRSGLRIIRFGRLCLDTLATTLCLTTIKSMGTGPGTHKRGLRKISRRHRDVRSGLRSRREPAAAALSGTCRALRRDDCHCRRSGLECEDASCQRTDLLPLL